MRANGRGRASFETQARRAEIIHQGFRTLWDLGCRLPSPWGFRERHMHKLGRYWESQEYRDIQNRFSTFRTFGNVWLHRPGMIKASETYVDNPESVKRKYVTNINRTWTGNGVDIETKIAEIASHDYRASVVLELCHAFGMRITESLKFRPHESAKEPDRINLIRGTKTGRPREVFYEEDSIGALQRSVIQKAKDLCGENESMIPKEMSFVAYRQRVYYIMRCHGISKASLGVTAHGLRHEYAVAYFERHTGAEAPVRDAESTVRPGDFAEVRTALGENLGHSRISITGAYLGNRLRKPDEPENNT
jgi:integrase